MAGRWRYLYRAVDQFGQVIDVLLAEQRDTAAARRFFTHALTYGPAPVEVTTDKAGPCLREGCKLSVGLLSCQDAGLAFCGTSSWC